MISHSELMINRIEKNEEKSFLRIVYLPMNVIAKITVETYGVDWELVDSLDLIFKDEKRRQKKTYESIGISKEEFLAGVDVRSGMREVSDYFIKHDGLLICEDIDLKRLNKEIMKNSFKCIDCGVFDISKEAEYCEVDVNEFEKDKERFLEKCLRKYKRIRKMEQNKCDCVVKNAYVMTFDYGLEKNFVYCNTTVGVICYGLEDDEWKMTKKEQKRTGMRIESLDIDSVKRQLRKKYKVANMSELFERLRKRAG